MSLYACLYFDSDKSVSVLPKRKCILRGPFEVQGEVEVDWRDERGQKERLIATVLRIEGKGKQHIPVKNQWFPLWSRVLFCSVP